MISKMIKDVCFAIARYTKDKTLHFLLGYVICDYSLSIFERLFRNCHISLILSIIAVTIFIIGKEIIDKKSGELFDKKDILAGYLGVLLKVISFLILVV